MTLEESIQNAVKAAVSSELEAKIPKLADRIAERLTSATRVDQYVSPEKAAQIVGYKDPETIRDLVRRGTLKRYGHGRIRVKLSELHAWLENHPPKPDVADELDKAVVRLVR